MTEDTIMRPGLQELVDGPDEPDAWSVFHENSKTSRLEPALPDAEVVARMKQLWDALPYHGHDENALPDALAALDTPLGDAILRRVTARDIAPAPMSLAQVATVLHAAYGVTRDNEDGGFPRPFRTVPSGGALYPLELYLHTSHVDGLTAGIHHFDPRAHALRLLQRGDCARQISEALVQPRLAASVSALVFVTAVFERSVFKYGNRGYRFILLEAGHVAQNINLVATALGFGCANIGGFFDRDIDRLLGLDGVRHSTVYLVGIGRHGDAAPAAGPRPLESSG
jgi:SagB-type dehydrogenase family enzyme